MSLVLSKIQNKTILLGDVIYNLKQLPDDFFNVIVTSPPYWGLRDYGVSGQWGSEPTYQEYLQKMSLFMEECKRVLRKDGVCWINLGDCFNNGNFNNIQRKSLFGIPQRFYINCIDSGWVSRNIIIWHKPNAMPCSIKDRFQLTYESLFFFTKSPRYYFNLDSIRVKPKTEYKSFNVRVRDSINGKAVKKMGESDKTYKSAEWEKEIYDKQGIIKQDNYIKSDGSIDNTKKGFNKRWIEKQQILLNEGRTAAISRTQSKLRAASILSRGALMNPKGKNPGDVWDITAKPFRGAHFATYPPDLIERILKCSCPQNGWVLDPFMGSGTTGLVSERLGLNWMGIELKKEYQKLAYNRIFILKK